MINTPAKTVEIHFIGYSPFNNFWWCWDLQRFSFCVGAISRKAAADSSIWSLGLLWQENCCWCRDLFRSLHSLQSGKRLQRNWQFVFFFFFWRPASASSVWLGCAGKEASEGARGRERQFQSLLIQWGRLWVEKKAATSNLWAESSLVFYWFFFWAYVRSITSLVFMLNCRNIYIYMYIYIVLSLQLQLYRLTIACANPTLITRAATTLASTVRASQTTRPTCSVAITTTQHSNTAATRQSSRWSCSWT